MTDWLGWLATAVFISSYFTKQAAALRRVQAVGAALWCAYGVVIHSWPVIVANVLVAGVAVASSLRDRGAVSRTA